MTTRMLAKSEWQSYCDKISKVLKAQQAQIDILGLAIGDQKLIGQWVPFLGIVYDHKDDLLEIALEGLDHMILKPREVYVDFNVGGLIGLAVIDSDHVRQIIKLKEPVALPVPEPAEPSL